MIDLDKLERVATRPGECALVTRRFLRQAARELRECRAVRPQAAEPGGQV